VSASQSSIYFLIFLNMPLWLALHKKKIMIFWYFPNINIFYQNRTMLNTIFLRNILNTNFVPTSFSLTKTFISNFVHYHFWPKAFTKAHILIVISYFFIYLFIYLNMVHNKAQMFWEFFFLLFFFLVCNGPFDLLI
jgi:hypothetical protein